MHARERLGDDPELIARVLVHRVRARARKRRLRATYRFEVARAPRGTRLRALPWTLPPVRDLPPALLSEADRIRAAAELALAHRTTLLCAPAVALGDPIAWHADFKSGYRWPRSFYLDVQATRPDDDSDAKAPWELSRGHQLVALARAACLFEDERYARELEVQLSHWIEENPPGIGINWVNPMEVGLRAVSWIWALGTLAASGRPVSAPLGERATRSLQMHGRHLAANLEGGPELRSNHYLADVLGLLALGWALEGEPRGPRWRRRARQAFEAEITGQVLEDGMSFEASLSYHGLALEMLLLARVIAGWAGTPLSPEYDRRLARMLELSASVRHPSGRIPLFGDGDSGRVLPTDEDRPPTHDNLLWLGAAILGAPAPRHSGSAEVAWWLGPDAWRAVQDRKPPGTAATPREEFPHGGLYVLRNARTHLVVRCGDVGQNGNGGHAHNDLLSYELSCDSDPIVVDSGTYAYTADPRARNAFRATAAHNGVIVAAAEINPIDDTALFRLAQVAQPLVEAFQQSPRQTRFVGSHDGYAQRTGIVHRRTIELDRLTGALEVTDELQGVSACAAVSTIHLHPAVEVLTLDCTGASLRSPHAALELRFRGLVEPPRLESGWVSERFGMRERAPVLTLRVEGRAPLRFGYRFTPPRTQGFADARIRASAPEVRR